MKYVTNNTEIFIEYSLNINIPRGIFIEYLRSNLAPYHFGWTFIKYSDTSHFTNIHDEYLMNEKFIHQIFIVNISWILVKCDLSNKIDSQIFTQYVRWIFDEWTFHSSNIHRTYWVNICGMRRVTKKKSLLTKNSRRILYECNNIPHIFVVNTSSTGQKSIPLTHCIPQTFS